MSVFVSVLVAMKTLDSNKVSKNRQQLVKRNVKPRLECGPIPNVMAALPNIGGALCSTPQNLPDAHY